MTRLTSSLIYAVAGLFILAPGAAPAQPGSTAKVPQVKFTDYRLPNGLRVILSVDHAAPVVAVSVTYNVGSRDERPGRTGFAHLFEHMMFQGSANVGKGEHMLLIQNNGGTMNGTTKSVMENGTFSPFASSSANGVCRSLLSDHVHYETRSLGGVDCASL